MTARRPNQFLAEVIPFLTGPAAEDG